MFKGIIVFLVLITGLCGIGIILLEFNVIMALWDGGKNMRAIVIVLLLIAGYSMGVLSMCLIFMGRGN